MRLCLLVDDSKVVRKLARRMIEPMGFEIEEAEDGKDALEKCQARMPYWILLDWHMPNMNGLEFVTALRALPNGKTPKVIFCTTENDLGHIMQAITAGADEYMMKPFDEGIIRGKMEQVGITP